MADATAACAELGVKSIEKLLEASRVIVDGVPNLLPAAQRIAKAYPPVHELKLGHTFDLDAYTNGLAEPQGADNAEFCEGTFTFTVQFEDAKTRVERLRECFEPVPWNPPTRPPCWTPDSLPVFPKIAEVSEAFTLNFWLHVAFEACSRHLLYRYPKDIEDAIDEPLYPPGFLGQPYDIKGQLTAYLGGEAGTGKSAVVHALLRFAQAWGREGSVETLAFTGIAVINVHGRTMHSARNLQLNGASPKTAPSLEMKAKYNRVVLVITDEISMIDQCVLGGTDAASRAMSPRSDLPMGGKHLMMTGDFLQLPPIGGTPCFTRPAERSSPLRHAGYNLYHRINFVVFLTENMRSRLDAEYTSMLGDLRWGCVSDAQLARLNWNVAPNVSSGDETVVQTQDFYRPVVVSTNRLRCAINREMLFSLARTLGQPIYECMAVPSVRSSTIVSALENVNNDLADRVPIKLHLLLGMPAMITRKHPKRLGADVIANGSLGTLIGFHPSTKECGFESTVVNGVTVRRFMRMPDMVLLKIHDCERQLAPQLPPGVIGLTPLHAQLRLNKLKGVTQGLVTVDQFAMVPAFSCTTEKLQGKTCGAGIVITRFDQRSALPNQTHYVALSRATRFEGVTLTEVMTRAYLDKFLPTPQTLEEMRRLIQAVVLPSYASSPQRAEFESWKTKQRL